MPRFKTAPALAALVTFASVIALPIATLASPSQDVYFDGPSGHAEFDEVIRLVVMEQFNTQGLRPLDRKGRPTSHYRSFLRRVNYIQEMAHHESQGWRPLIHTEYLKSSKNDGSGFWQTVNGWLQMREDTYEYLRDRWVSYSKRNKFKLPTFFKNKCGESDSDQGTGVFSLECQAWVVSWEMAEVDPAMDPRGKKSQLKLWGPVKRAKVNWKKAQKRADLEYALAIQSKGSQNLLARYEPKAAAKGQRLGSIKSALFNLVASAN